MTLYLAIVLPVFMFALVSILLFGWVEPGLLSRGKGQP